MSFLLNPNNATDGTSLSAYWQNLNEFGIREGLIESVITAFFNVLTLKDIDVTHPNPNRLKVELRPVDLDQHSEIAVIKIKVPMKENEHGVMEEVEVIEDKALLINPNTDEFSIFIIHQGAQRLLRNDLSFWIKTVRAFEMIDVEALRNSLKVKSAKREEKLLEIIAKGLPIFKIQI